MKPAFSAFVKIWPDWDYRNQKNIRPNCEVVSIFLGRSVFYFIQIFIFQAFFGKQVFIQYAHSRENRLAISMS